ncbi:hypothetical protein [Desulfovibrio litoralis]|uniref:LTXXQ motif family protein n=1 Tax=Desulfovibrio litoralis DSM 11393 TaxID=1121455 RepID=A0A1M7TQZ7_9BACT|nr:hypothetical protein [Desulfovibrio litoralis]SHN73152.1 hypothetical protein SAMN02745728_02386 [Desulfovibrio litoralis DSM 11393]
MKRYFLRCVALCALVSAFCVNSAFANEYSNQAGKLQRLDQLEQRMLAKQMRLITQATTEREKATIEQDTREKQARLQKFKNKVAQVR